MRLRYCLLLAAVISGCWDTEADDDEPLVNADARQNKAEKVFHQHTDKTTGGGLKLKEFNDAAEPPPKKVAEVTTPPDAGAPKLAENPVVDAGAQLAAATELDAGAALPPPPLDNPLLTGWKNAQPGDFAKVSCSADATMFGNEVLRTVELTMAVSSATADSVTLAFDSEVDLSRPKSQKNNKKAKQGFHDKVSFQLTVARANGTKLPAIPRPLSEPGANTFKVNGVESLAVCTFSDDSENGGPMRQRCTHPEPAKLYLTSGLLNEESSQESKTSEHLDKCTVTAFGRAAPPAIGKRVNATDWALAERGDSHFREQVVSAKAGMIEVQFDRLSVAKKADKNSVTFASTKYQVGVRDKRVAPLLDWALQRAMSGFPGPLSEP